jgi:hypothetical protein
MGYYDGNTVTALWNYAQHFAMSDNFFGSNFGTTVRDGNSERTVDQFCCMEMK